MGSIRFRKSVKLGPGVRLNVSKRGVGVSGGVRGARVSAHTSGRRTTSVGVPGTGLGYTHTRGGGKSKASRGAPPAAPVASMPKPGMFAPKHEKRFAKALNALLKNDRAGALRLFKESSEEDTSNRAVADDLFAGLLTAEAGNSTDAIPYLESVVSSEVELPDALMQKYRVGGHLPITVGHIELEVPWSSIAAALALSSAYQQTDRHDEAIGVLQQLADVGDDPAVLLALCDLYADAGAWDEIVDAAAGTTNEDDLTLQLRLYQARALREQGMQQAALEAYKDALRSKKRDPELLKEARYHRGKLLLELGKTSQAMRDLETVYAADPLYEDVTDLVSVNPA